MENSAAHFKILLEKEDKLNTLNETRKKYQDLLMLWDWFNHGTILEDALADARTAYMKALMDAEDYSSYM